MERLIYTTLSAEAIASAESWSASGYGSGDGDGSETYIDAILTSCAQDRIVALRASGAVLAFWRSGADGRPCNGGSGKPAKVGMIQEESCALTPCRRGALHGTLHPQKWKGERLWVVALYAPVVKVDEDKLASSKREILAEVPNWFLGLPQ